MMRFALIVGIVTTATAGLRAEQHVCNYRHPERIVLVKPQVAAARPTPATGGVTFSVTFEEPDGEFAAWNNSVEPLVTAAAAEWGRFLDGAANIEIELRFRDSGSLGGASVLASAESSRYFFQDRTDDGIAVFMSGVIGEIAGLGDPDDEEFDGVININSDRLANFSFGPAPPPGSHDLYSVILHELGHILGFAGSVSFGSGGDWKSTFDLNAEYDPDTDRFFFTGDAATDNFGGRVWLAGTPHVGDEISSLMNATTGTGRRLSVGKLELAMLADSGLPVGLFCWSLPSLDEPDCADDTDGDGIPDYLDECPDDLFKITADACGCGVPDVDSDSDGTPDCLDACPGDPDRIEAGERGCNDADEARVPPVCGAGTAVPMAFAMLTLCIVRRRL